MGERSVGIDLTLIIPAHPVVNSKLLVVLLVMLTELIYSTNKTSYLQHCILCSYYYFSSRAIKNGHSSCPVLSGSLGHLWPIRGFL